MTSDGTRNLTYTSFDQVSKITTSTSAESTTFDYDGQHQRYRRTDMRVNKSGTTKITTLYVGGLYESISHVGDTKYSEKKFYIGNIVITERSNSANDTYYLHSDGQGSTTTVTNSNGEIVQQFIYDPWGKQEQIFNHSSLLGTYVSPASSRGYTGHEGIDDFDIIHMNGRIYDPTIARFLQADPHIQAPANTQNYNRYSYVLNNPLNYTDPTGFSFKTLLKSIMKSSGSWATHKFLNRFPVLNTIVSVALNFIPGCQVWCTAAFNAQSSFVANGSLSGAIKTGAISAATAYALQGIGGDGFWGQAGSPQNIIADGLVSGISAELQGGKFGQGFFAAGITAAFKPYVNQIGNKAANYAPARVTAAAVIGGTASVVSGGKFANGAAVGAFVQMYNGETALAKERDAQKAPKIIDSTSEALDHYFDGNGEAVELGPNTKDALRNHPLVQRQSEALRLGTAKHLNDNLSVEMRGDIYHVGKTRVDFSTVCQSGSCTTTYVGFSNDGFWDPIAPTGFGDGIGGDWEIYGGTGYRYNTYTWSETYTDKF